jgi:ubiquinone biosynthesis monooxygenase Coq7
MSERPPYLPGDPVPEAELARMLRVDQAGEYGATRIYDGQLALIRGGAARRTIADMAAQERRHRAVFDDLLRRRRVRPTALEPLWHGAGYLLGAATAWLGERAAMACTVAVEEVIDAHYRDQEERLGGRDPEIAAAIRAARADERAHRDTALAAGAAEAPGYTLLTGLIKSGSRLAIWLATRI